MHFFFPMNSFRFKQFEVVQDYSAMRVNTDAVLLGAWMSLPKGRQEGTQGSLAGEVPCNRGSYAGGELCRPGSLADGKPCSPARMLDIGTGTGVIALMAAQRAAQAGLNAIVEAVEIDEGACKDAAANFQSAPWNGVELVLHKKSLQEFSENFLKNLPDNNTLHKFDLIFTNPPYFIDSLKSTDESKILARHTDTLSQREILFHCTKLVKPEGMLAVVLPVIEGEEFLRKVEFLMANTPAGELCFVPKRICRVHTVERKPAKRLLMELVLLPAGNAKENPHIEQLVMMSGDSKTAQYADLVGEFYL